MSRIGERFTRLRREGKKAFVAFLTAGDPSLEATVRAARDLERGGADVLELIHGAPHSVAVLRSRNSGR
jgi:tryptophan synthase alpha chain